MKKQTIYIFTPTEMGGDDDVIQFLQRSMISPSWCGRRSAHATSLPLLGVQLGRESELVAKPAIAVIAENRRNTMQKAINIKPETFDMREILDDTPAETPWVIIGSSPTRPIGLFIRDSLLASFAFSQDDAPSVVGEKIRPEWGTHDCPNLTIKGGELALGDQLYTPCPGWRFAPVSVLYESVCYQLLDQELAATLRAANCLPYQLYISYISTK